MAVSWLLFSIIPLGLTILIFNQSLLVLYLTLSFLFHPYHFTSDSFISYFPPHIFIPISCILETYSIKPFIHLILCTFVILCISLFNKPFFQSYSFCLICKSLVFSPPIVFKISTSVLVFNIYPLMCMVWIFPYVS